MYSCEGGGHMDVDDALTTRLAQARVDLELDEGGRERVHRAVIESSRRRRVRRATVAGAAALTLGAGLIALPAAADVVREFLAQTGVVCEGSECGGDWGEMIDLGAPDVDEFVASKYPDYLVLAPGQSRDGVVAQVQEAFPTEQNAVTPEASFAAEYEHLAYCGWIDEWLRADAEADLTARGDASDVLTEMLTWPGPMQTTDDPNIIVLQSAFAEAAREGDDDGVKAGGYMNRCPGYTESKSAWIRSNVALVG